MLAASQKDGALVRQERVDHALELLRQALQIIDSLDEFPELGAKLSDVIEGLQAEPDRPMPDRRRAK